MDDLTSLTLALMVKAANEQFNDGFIDVIDYGKAMVEIAVDYIDDEDNLGALAVLSYLPLTYFKEEMVLSAITDRHFAKKVAKMVDMFGTDVALLLVEAEGVS